MKLRQAFFLIALILLGGTLCRGQTSFVTGNLNAVGAACSTSPPTNTQRIVISNTNFGGATFTVSGTFVATLGFWGSGDAGQTWQPLLVTPSSSTTPVTTTTTAGLWQANVSAYTHLCILAMAYTSGTAVVRIHVSSISARAGGGGGGSGGGGVPTGSVPGQVLAVGASGVVAVSPGLADSTASPISGAYTPLCTTATNTGDRARVMVIAAPANITIPAAATAGCANSIFYFLAQAATQFTASPGNTFDIYNGSTVQTGATSLSIAAGQYATIDNGAGTNWHILVESGGGASGAPALSSLTAATAANTLVNAANTQTWSWSDTNSGPSMVINESAPSTGGVITGGINNQSILEVDTAAGSTATPLGINQGTVSSTTAPAAAQIQTTWNNAALPGQGLLIQATCTACAAGSNAFNILNGSGTSVFSITPAGFITMASGINSSGNFTNTNNNGVVTTYRVNSTYYQANNNQANTPYQGGADVASSVVLGSGIFRGADNTIQTVNPGPSAGAGILRGGMMSGSAGSASMQGPTEVASGYFTPAGNIAAAGDVVCATTVQFQVIDCPVGQTNVIGIADNTANPAMIILYGEVPVRLTAAGVLGHTVCMSTTTAGQASDSGGTAVCPTAGTQIGVIVATTGTLPIASGLTAANVTLSTTLPLVQLHFR